MVSLSGGDPLLREDLPEVVRAVARHHFPLVTTHGFHVTRERARALWESGLEAATVTLDHADAVRQDAAAGMPGSHGRALLALAAFAATRTRAGQQVNVKTRLRAETLEGLDDLLKLAAEQGASVTVEPAYPLPSGLEGIQKRLRDLRSRRSNLRIGPFFLDHIEQALAGGVPGCQAGKAFFNVDERGRVSKCVEFRRPEDRAGDLSREPLREVFPRLRRIHQSNDCRACWMASRGEVEGLYTVRGLLQALPALVRA
jgi:MoaA/NifB/PqqE/SkfB family radical SAM enzyme